VGALPASIEVTLHDGIREVAAIHPVVERLRAIAGVEEVEVVDDWVAQVTGLVHAARTLGALLALLAAAASVWVIAAAVRLGMAARAGEAEVLRLVGASPSFVRGPLLVEGALQGAAGAALAALLLWTLFAAGASRLESALSPVAGEVTLVFLSAGHVAALVAAGGLLGLIGGATGARRVLA
jgi:cell division transport system permease protein